MGSKEAQSSAYEVQPSGSNMYHGDIPVATNPQSQPYIEVGLVNRIALLVKYI